MEVAVSRLIFGACWTLVARKKGESSKQQSAKRILLSYQLSAISFQLWNRKELVVSDQNTPSHSPLSTQHLLLSTEPALRYALCA